MSDLNQQIDAAFSYRGDVTVSLKDGSTIVGFLSNRDFKPHASLRKEPFVELFLPEGGRREILIADLSSVALSGVDHAAT